MISDPIKARFRDYPFFAELALNFFTCIPPHEKIYKDIEEVLSKREKRSLRPSNNIYSLNDFMYYCFAKNYCPNGFPGGVADKVVNKLISVSVLTRFHEYDEKQEEEKYITTSYEYLKFLKDNKLLKNLLFGFNYIIEKYKIAVPIIAITLSNSTVSSGTGFIVSLQNSYFIITNKHVIENASKVEILIDERSIEFENFKMSPTLDLAFSKLVNYVGHSFYLNQSMEILDEIITIGYPTIPLTKFAHQVFHKGEINSFIEDYFGNNLFLISARTSSGNSGSPVIDKHGSVVGIICRELFQKDQLIEKGILPYYAAIPTSTILIEHDKLT